MTYYSIEFRTAVLLSFQQALLDLVTPPLRAVSVTPTRPVIRAVYTYESLSEEDRQFMLEVETYVAADFHSPVNVEFRAVKSTSDQRLILPTHDVWVFRRHEEWPG